MCFCAYPSSDLDKKAKQEMFLSADEEDNPATEMAELDPQGKGSFEYDLAADPFFLVDEEANKELEYSILPSALTF